MTDDLQIQPAKPKITLSKPQFEIVEALQDKAESRAGSSPTGLVLLGLAAFFLAAPVGLELAIVVAVPFAYASIKRALQNGENAEYLLKTGNFAHLLNDRELIKLSRTVGKDVVIEMLLDARSDHKPLSGAAMNYLEHSGVTLDEVSDLETFLKGKLAEQPEKQESGGLAQFVKSFFGSGKKGEQPQSEGAIDVPAQAIDSTAGNLAPTVLQNQPADSVAVPTFQPPSADPMKHLIGSRPRCSLIVAVSGGGKDFLLSNALREFLRLKPNFQVIVADCKDDPKERGYYADLPRTTVYRMHVTEAVESTALAWIDAFLDDFGSRTGPTLLIINEGIAVRSLSKRYVNVVSGFVSNGDSREKYIWEAGDSAHTDELKISGSARSRFRPLAIALEGEDMQTESILKAQWLADAARDMRQVESAMRKSPVKRAWCDGRHWHPMPELINYAGYDRDARSPLEPSEKTVIQADYEPELDPELEPNLELEPEQELEAEVALETKEDPIEQTIIDVLKKFHPEGATIGKIQGQRRILKDQSADTLREFCEVLVSEDKINQEGANYYYKPNH